MSSQRSTPSISLFENFSFQTIKKLSLYDSDLPFLTLVRYDSISFTNGTFFRYIGRIHQLFKVRVLFWLCKVTFRVWSYQLVCFVALILRANKVTLHLCE
jgi:hypothetical protein